jgi:hypothetical protein
LSYRFSVAAVDVRVNAVAFVELLKVKRRMSGEGALVGDVREEDAGSVAWMSELVTAFRMRAGGRLNQALAARGEGLAKAGKGNKPHFTSSVGLIRNQHGNV